MDTPLNEGRTMRTRRIGQAAALLLAPWGFVIANAADAWTKRHGGSDETATGALQLSLAHPSLEKWAIVAVMVGSVLMIPAVLGAMRLLRERAPRLSLLAGALVITGYVCYFGLCFQSYATIAMAQHGGVTRDHVAVLDATMNQGFFIVPALVFIAGNIIGTFLLGLALIRSRVVPRWAALCVLAWPVLHIVGGTWGEVAGAALQAIGLAVVGLQLLGPAGARAVRSQDPIAEVTPVS
jgi:hypothetical protein